MTETEKKKVGSLWWGIPLTVIGASLIVHVFFNAAHLSDAARSWERIPCKVYKTELESHHGTRGGTSYTIDVRYRYVYEGREYEGDRTSVSRIVLNFNSRQEAQRHADSLRARGLCWVNPADPSESAVEMPDDGGLGGNTFLLLFGMVFGGAGVYLIYRHLQERRPPDAPWTDGDDSAGTP